MAGISGYGNLFSGYGSLYGGLYNRGTSGYGMGINYGDYYMIKNGTYKKLAKAYYSMNKTDSTNKTSSSTGSTSTKQNTALRDSANALKSSARALRDKTLWQKKDITTKDETTGEATTKQDYDYDAILKAVKQFTEDYNSVLDQAADSDSTAILREASSMVNTSNAMSRLLDEVGISIGTDNKLSIDEEKFKSARITTLNTLFAGSNSYAGRMGQRAGNIVNRIPKSSSVSTVSKKTSGTSSSSETTDKTSNINAENKTSTNKNTSIPYGSIYNAYGTTYSPYGSAYTPYGGYNTNDALSQLIRGSLDQKV